ncbi:hypothetical protein GWK47_012602 [Chionoecetes opilio]|uniref:Uncharacterized protein n=1 Tax=Chionoecetes opilio TaxID=41210 RepID=A0A8J4Y5C8_CHIOP|nr:hypothetical protein GWK47_012602 [Chionoecetes opilio]
MIERIENILEPLDQVGYPYWYSGTDLDYERSSSRQVGMVLVASLAFLQLGMAITWPSALAAHLPHDNSTLFNYHLHITPPQEWIGSLMFFWYHGGVAPNGFYVDWLGRRLSMAVSSLPTALGWLLITFANNKPHDSLPAVVPSDQDHTARMLQDTGVTLDPSLGTLILNYSVSVWSHPALHRGGSHRPPLELDGLLHHHGSRIHHTGLFHLLPFPSPKPQLQPDLEISMFSSLGGNATALVSAQNKGMCMCLLFAGVTSMASIQLYSTLVDNITLPGLFWTYALFATGGMLHTLFFIRETSRQNIG